MQQLFSNLIPFSNIRRDTHVLLHVVKGGRPPKPESSPNVGLTDEVWSLIQQGWSVSPNDRPSLTTFLDAVQPDSSSRRISAQTGGIGSDPSLHATLQSGWAVPPRLLLVDDEAVVRGLSRRFLQVFGCKIDVAFDGVAAVEMLRAEQYDLVLMDIQMPRLDGVAATRLIRVFDPRTPIVAMTSASQPHELVTYFDNGMNDILPKPFTREGLFAMLEVSSRRSARFRPKLTKLFRNIWDILRTR
jgi:CheY-like chemotaxis protein